MTDKWNVVYTKTVAGTVSQEKIDMLKESVKNNPHIFEGTWNIELTSASPDSDYAKVLMLQHETIEEEDIDMEMEECAKL